MHKCSIPWYGLRIVAIPVLCVSPVRWYLKVQMILHLASRRHLIISSRLINLFLELIPSSGSITSGIVHITSATMLTLPYYMQSMRWVVPAGFLLGSAPVYYAVWGGWRIVSAVLPARVFEAGDEIMYSMYQRLILFFFHSVSGIEVMIDTVNWKFIGY
jgi:hypothetical protein